jgi:hypothetical protein
LEKYKEQIKSDINLENKTQLNLLKVKKTKNLGNKANNKVITFEK